MSLNKERRTKYIQSYYSTTWFVLKVANLDLFWDRHFSNCSISETMTKKQQNVSVVVLGDIGRSPRMQYHSQSLAEAGHKVDIVGYWGSAPLEALSSQPLVSFHYLTQCPSLPLPRVVNYLLKTIWQLVNLCMVFAIMRKSDIVLVQNPPAIPTLLICWFYSFICRAKFIIDWHNYAHTIMALSSSRRSPLVKLAKSVEMFFGQRADYNFCVTKEMKIDLENIYGIKATTLYDRPAEMFRPLSKTVKDDFRKRFSKDYEEVINKFGHSLSDSALLVSSTSWTEDEDFDVLLNALNDYNQCLDGEDLKLPPLICAITGKGPLKSFYTDKLAKANWKNVLVLTPWLTMEDYPKLLASADLGVCLHTSSSGLDLPMKVVDMFGCGLPVCAYDFKCLHELVKHEVNGFTFTTSVELSKLLQKWFADFPNNAKQKELEGKFKKELEKFQALRWQENWTMLAGPVFK